MHAKGNKFLKTGVYKIKTKCDLKKKQKNLFMKCSGEIFLSRGVHEPKPSM